MDLCVCVVKDVMQVEVIRTYTAKQPDELSLQVADVVLISQTVEGALVLNACLIYCSVLLFVQLHSPLVFLSFHTSLFQAHAFIMLLRSVYSSFSEPLDFAFST